jgi:hypothetical protein
MTPGRELRLRRASDHRIADIVLPMLAGTWCALGMSAMERLQSQFAGDVSVRGAAFRAGGQVVNTPGASCIPPPPAFRPQ